MKNVNFLSPRKNMQQNDSKTVISSEEKTVFFSMILMDLILKH